MATMVKEKPRTKKKTKEKHITKSVMPTEDPSVIDLSSKTEEAQDLEKKYFKSVEQDISLPSCSTREHESDLSRNDPLLSSSQSSVDPKQLVESNETEIQVLGEVKSTHKEIDKSHSAYADVCKSLDIITFKDIPGDADVPIEVLESRLEASTSYLNQTIYHTQANTILVDVDRVEDALPSAPVLEEAVVVEAPVETEEVLRENRPKVQCMPIDVAMQVFGGKEMAEVREISEREEAFVEAGSLPGPDHPLVDLLSTFRCSLTAREQVSQKIAQGYAAAENERIALWKIEKRTICVSEQCPCGLKVYFNGKYDYAELMKQRLPAAQLRLEGLLKEVQESLCQYQHAALLAYYQIEELVSETLQSGKGVIRAALALVLHELRMCDAAPALLCGALRRWARALAGALVDARDPGPLLFLMHHLFRQSRSVRWAAPLVRVPAADRVDAARALALLARLLAGPALEAARECTEENEEMWEEVCARGGGGAVSEGALRERDLLALLRAFPLRALAARLVLLTRSDITRTRPYEWEFSAREVLRSLCGVRALLYVVRSATRAHAGYTRLRATLAALAHATLRAAAALHQHNKNAYPKELDDQIEAELEALFVEGYEVGGPRPPASLLRAATRTAYCVALITRLHDTSPFVVEPPGLEVRPEGCARAVRDVTRAAADCADAELARLVLDFLVRTSLKRGAACGGACVGAARVGLPRLLRAHECLHATALHTVAELYLMDPLAPSDSLEFLSLARWRPAVGEVRAVLDDWALRCPPLLPSLLLGLRYTPHDGLSLEAQRAVGAWLCARAPTPEWAWPLLARLRVHRSSWGLPLEAPPPEDTSSLFAEAYAVLSSSWGHSVPEICEYGVSALCRVASAQPAAAAHALPLVMTAMASSPESVSLTPQFAQLAAALAAPAQSLVQWARGARGDAADLLRRRMLAQIEAQSRGDAAAAWLRALCQPALAGARLAVCDLALLAAPRAQPFQEAPPPEVLAHLVRNAAHAPLTCEAALRAAHAQELAAPLLAPLAAALAAQRAAGQRAHVDNALKQIGSTIGSEELVVYRAAAAALAAPCAHPAHLALWRLLLHLYLQTPANAPDTAPIGVAFFSGLIKSRTLAQLKKRLQETIAYHHSQADAFKTSLSPAAPKPTSDDSKPVSPVDVLAEATIADLTGDSSDSSDSEEFDSDEDSTRGEDDSARGEDDVSDAEEKRRIDVNMLKYHESAEKMLSEYLCWLEAGERLRAAPHHADIARFIPEPALATARRRYLSATRPARSAADDDLRAPRAPPAPAPPRAPLPDAVRALLRVPEPRRARSRVPTITSPVENVDFDNQRQLYSAVDKHLAALEDFAREWASDVERVAALDGKLWPLVGALRVRVALPPVARACANKCAPVALTLQGCYEWRISEGAATSIKDNRSSARAAVARLSRARPRAARTVASLNTIARRVRSAAAALGVAERAWRCAGAAPPCAPAADALAALVDRLAERWLRADEAAGALAARWCAGAAAAQHAMCGALLARVAAPRARVYVALVDALARAPDPSRAFSYLSKFDMSAPPESEAARGEMLRALAAAAQRWGRAPAPDLLVLLELIGVHTAALMNAAQLAPAALDAARAAAAGAAPPALLAHVARAAAAAAADAPFDELGNLLRELGAVWWAARAQLRAHDAPDAQQMHAEHAPHAAELHAALLRAFVAAARARSYTPERVGWYTWAALQEAWGAWVSPHPALPPLLAAAPRAAMLRRFRECLLQAAADCPGCEEQLLSSAFEWTAQAGAAAGAGGAGGAGGAQLADLLHALGALPWQQHQWPRASTLHAALQISATGDEQLRAWAAGALRGVRAAAWLRVPDAEVAPRLAALLALAAGTLPLRPETLSELAALPWARLPERALEPALQAFFERHHSPLRAYHDAPQFSVILAASGLRPWSARAREHRACAVSLWTRAASAPQLLAHAAAHAHAMLEVIDSIEPQLEEGSGELEELLQRASAILCVEPAAAAALPEWERWARRAGRRAAAACLAAARALPAPRYCAPLADAAAAALLAKGGSWQTARERLGGCEWVSARALLAGGRAHAAYALALHAPAPPADLVHGAHSFAEDEVITSVWICALCRCARAGCAGAGELLARWAAPPRLALLRAVLPGAARPAARHRLLCQLALCIITPGSEPLIRAYEAACPGVPGSSPAAASWARAPRPQHLPRLAVLLHPGRDNYFTEEIKMADAMEHAHND